MKFASTGIRVRLRSFLRTDRNHGRAGYLLLEALVALALVLAFAAVLGPVLFQARGIMTGADDRVAAQALLRTLLDSPLDRAALDKGNQGKTAGLQWRITATPMHAPRRRSEDADSLDNRPAIAQNRQRMNAAPGQQGDRSVEQQQASWAPYRIVATVSWGGEYSITGETVRLGKVQ